ncbi:MAG TPA: ABC transporter permease subunit, partial [Bryobacteraceae bacterium]|nr:ABC transporter permease subunit [Bryobacteraceae bacterium]
MGRLAEPRWVRNLLIGVTLLFLGSFLLLPLVVVFTEALRNGLAAYLASFSEPDALAAIRLTLLAAGIAVPVNCVFGLAASWAIAKFEFPGKAVLISLIDLPFAISPVISGMVYVLVFGLQGWLGPWLAEREMRIIFAVPGVVLATMFVTLPYVARELIPLMQEQGIEEEEAAAVLGASGWQTLTRVKLPMLMPSITICTFLTLTNGFKLFDQNLALNGGQPFEFLADGNVIKTTEMLALNIYNTFYQNSNS